MYKKYGSLRVFKSRGSLIVAFLLSGLLLACGSETPLALTTAPATTTLAPTTTVATTTAPVPLTKVPASPTVTVAPATTQAAPPPVPTTVPPATTTTRPASLSPTAASAIGSPGTASTTAVGSNLSSLLSDFSGDRAMALVSWLAGNIGIRAVGMDGERKGAEYIENYFKSLGLTAQRLPVEINRTVDTGSSLSFQYKTGLQVQIKGNALGFSGVGKINAPVTYVELGIVAQIPAGSLKGKVALMQRGQISFQEKLDNAVKVGAVGLIVYNNQEGSLESATLRQQASIPVVGISQADGERLVAELKANQNLSVGLEAAIQNKTVSMSNVLGQRPASRPNAPILIIGGHFDSVPAGPGANDNASGTAIVMELARVLQTQYPGYELRFVAFSGEEIGLIGSSDYVKKLTQAERQRVTAMINIDMVSVGSQLSVGGAENLTRLALAASIEEGAGNVQGLSKDLAGASDHFPFQEAGIPVLFLNRQSDPNYHRPGDTPDKVQPDRLNQVGRIVIKVIDALAKP